VLEAVIVRFDLMAKVHDIGMWRVHQIYQKIALGMALNADAESSRGVETKAGKDVRCWESCNDRRLDVEDSNTWYELVEQVLTLPRE